jgi:hypothetical protein
MSIVTVTRLSSPGSPNVIFGTSGSFGFHWMTLGEVGEELPHNCVLKIGELYTHECVPQSCELTSGDCGAFAPRGDFVAGPVRYDGGARAGAIEDVVAEFWVVDINYGCDGSMYVFIVVFSVEDLDEWCSGVGRWLAFRDVVGDTDDVNEEADQRFCACLRVEG